MKLYDLIKGNNIFVQIPFGKGMREFSSKVLGEKDGSLFLSVVRVGGNNLRMPTDKGVNIIYQVFNRLYIWSDVRIDSMMLDGRIIYRILDADLDSKFYNRRGAYRLPVDEKHDINILSGRSFTPSNCTLDNISESGLGFTSVKDLEFGTKVVLRYATEIDEIEILAFIVRKVYNSSTATFSYGCRTPEFNERLNSFIMKEQIRRRKVTA